MVGDCTEIGFYKDMLQEDNNICAFRTKFSSKLRLKVWIIRRVYTSAYTYTRCPLCKSLQNAFRVDHRRVDDSYFKLYFLENEASDEQIVFFFLQFIFVPRIEPLPYHTICCQTDRLRTACPIQLKNLKISWKIWIAGKNVSHKNRAISRLWNILLLSIWPCDGLATSYEDHIRFVEYKPAFFIT